MKTKYEFEIFAMSYDLGGQPRVPVYGKGNRLKATGSRDGIRWWG